MDKIIEVKNLHKKYGDFVAVDHISFDVNQNEVFGILGPNGAGKTTTLEMMEGLKKITGGEALLDGHDVSKQTFLVKSLIGVQLQSSSFFDGLTLVELLATFAALYNRRVDAKELLAEVQLSEKAKSNIKELSSGQKQRFSIAAALVNDPKVLFLDEPTTGLDPQARRNLWELISNIHRSGKTIVLTTHYMEEAEVLCDRIAIMDYGKIVALDKTENLLKLPGLNSSIHFRAGKMIDLAGLKKLPGINFAEQEDYNYRLVTIDPEKSLSALFNFAQSNNFNLIDLQFRQPTLEDVFLKLTGHALRD